MLATFRASMTWLHTWFGLVLGFVLMVVFFFGSLSVFDREIDRWAIAETRFDPQPMPSFDTMLAPIFARVTPDEEELAAARERVGGPDLGPLPQMTWSAYTTHRDPVLALYTEFRVANPNDPHDHVHGHVTIDPRNGNPVSDDQLEVGSGFFYPMHFMLHLHWLDLGYWVVAIAALVMLVALVSGVVMHRKLFREMFTFRPEKSLQRSSLDLHNLTGVLALPFHFMFPLTGLIIFAGIYFPLEETMLKPLADEHAQLEAATNGLALEPAGRPGTLASVDAMVVEAKRRWALRDMPGEVGYLAVTHVGDANAYVSLYRAGSDRVALVGQAIHFEGSTGRVILEEPPPTVVSGINDFLVGLHLQHFEHWLLRFLYVLGGLSGCVCIGTGIVFFVTKRKRKHAAQGISGARWVDALAVTTVTGMVAATLALLVATRLLPADLAERAVWQERVFWLTWLLMLGHAALRSGAVQQGRISPAWREQCWVVCVLALAAVVLNGVMTGDHLVRTISTGYWPVAGFDVALLCVAVISALVARHLGRRETTPATDGPQAADVETPMLETDEVAHA